MSHSVTRISEDNSQAAASAAEGERSIDSKAKVPDFVEHLLPLLSRLTVSADYDRHDFEIPSGPAFAASVAPPFVPPTVGARLLDSVSDTTLSAAVGFVYDTVSASDSQQAQGITPRDWRAVILAEGGGNILVLILTSPEEN